LHVSEVFLSTEEFDGAGPPWLIAWILGLELWEEEDVARDGRDSSGAGLKEERERVIEDNPSLNPESFECQVIAHTFSVGTICQSCIQYLAR